MAALLLGVLALSTSPASAQTPDCPFDGDLQKYLECLAGTTVPTTDTTISPTSTAVSSTVSGGGGGGGGAGAGGGSGGSGTLPQTGSDSGRLMGIGVALLVLGGAALYGSSRARRSEATA